MKRNLLNYTSKLWSPIMCHRAGLPIIPCGIHDEGEAWVLCVLITHFNYNLVVHLWHCLVSYYYYYSYCKMKTGCRCFVCFQSLEHLLYLLLFGFGLIVKHYNSPPQAIVYIYMNTKRDYVLLISFVIPYWMDHFIN